ncbi:TPA: hypothetical protein P0N76_000226 [Yersinia enterocolitica]|uniref:hypothetical protein n=1 Tax=Yersinia enterocolitica TaxID=630 RepID=UPI0029C1B8E7|nr:hypothetical protein [Yersinia enterocolitica]EKN5979509.1 hypothetical protein [Yersinia enterocolitica]EKN6380633.1 hypothetical protein [Yersinia enterocolitica]HDM8275878.1 hypothetical protein [Yersinia enterocolitica]HEI6925584.1 hypothetical protein [Yersinia enterocolitica]
MKHKQWISTQKHKQLYLARIEFEEWWIEREWAHPFSRFILKTSGFVMLIVLGVASMFLVLVHIKKPSQNFILKINNADNKWWSILTIRMGLPKPKLLNAMLEREAFNPRRLTF